MKGVGRMFESCPAQSKLFYTKKLSLKKMKRTPKNKRKVKIHIPIAPRPKRKTKYLPPAPSPYRKKELKIKKKKIPIIPIPFKEIKKDIKKISSSIKELENKEKLGLRKFTKKIENWMTKETEKISPQVVERQSKHFNIPKPHTIQTPRQDITQIKPSPVYEVHVIEDLPDSYQLYLSRAARRNKVLKKLIVEEERLKKKMSELENKELVYYRM